MNGGSGQDSAALLVKRSSRNRPTLNETGFLTVTFTLKPMQITSPREVY